MRGNVLDADISMRLPLLSQHPDSVEKDFAILSIQPDVVVVANSLCAIGVFNSLQTAIALQSRFHCLKMPGVCGLF